MWWPTTQLAISRRTFIVDARGAGYLQMRWRILGSLEVSLAHVLSGIAVGILSLVLRTVISRGRDEYGAVERTLKGILTICTLLVFPVVVASILHGRLSIERAESLSTPQDMYIEGETFRACALSLFFHRGSPRVPTFRADVRFFELPERAESWVGGGADLTPFFFMEEDVIQFHRFWRTLCVDIVGESMVSLSMRA